VENDAGAGVLVSPGIELAKQKLSLTRNKKSGGEVKKLRGSMGAGRLASELNWTKWPVGGNP